MVYILTVTIPVVWVILFVIIANTDEPHKDDSAYDTCSMPGDLSASSEPYSEISNNAESGSNIYRIMLMIR